VLNAALIAFTVRLIAWKIVTFASIFNGAIDNIANQGPIVLSGELTLPIGSVTLSVFFYWIAPPTWAELTRSDWQS